MTTPLNLPGLPPRTHTHKENTSRKPLRTRQSIDVEPDPKDVSAVSVFDAGCARMIRKRLEAYRRRERARSELDRIDKAEDPEIRAELFAQFFAEFDDLAAVEQQAIQAEKHWAWTWHERERTRW